MAESPRNVRNFWIEIMVDGKKTEVATGPKSEYGGFKMNISMRGQDGKIQKDIVNIDGYCEDVSKDGKTRSLQLTFSINNVPVTSVLNRNELTVIQR